MSVPTPPERLAATAGRLATRARWLADRRVLLALRRVRRAIKQDSRLCPDDRRGVSFGEVMWSPKPWWTEQFYWMLRTERPERVLELGTSLGMTGLYVLAALARNGTGRFFTIELGRSKVAYARDLFAAFGDARATCLQGRSDRVLPEVFDREPVFDWVFIDIDHQYESTMAHLTLLESRVRPGGWLVFDDINYSDDMRRAWSEVSRHPGFAWTTLRWRHRPDAEPRMGLGRRLADG